MKKDMVLDTKAINKTCVSLGKYMPRKLRQFFEREVDSKDETRGSKRNRTKEIASNSHSKVQNGRRTDDVAKYTSFLSHSSEKEARRKTEEKKSWNHKERRRIISTMVRKRNQYNATGDNESSARRRMEGGKGCESGSGFALSGDRESKHVERYPTVEYMKYPYV